MAELRLLAVVGLLLAFSGRAYSQDRADDPVGLKSIMSEPGVKLVAVDFWSEYCKPCVEALPRWRKLHDKYRDLGFRLVLVSFASEGKCPIPDWVPDKKVCDFSGDIARSWDATDLPQAFLWTWQGSKLLDHATVEEVERRVETWFRDVPRILVQPASDDRGRAIPEANALRLLVRDELLRFGKFELVAGDDELQQIHRLRKDLAKANYADALKCKIGGDMPPNSLLKSTVLKSSNSRSLLLQLFSLETGCIMASAMAPMSIGSSDLRKPTVEAVAKLARDLHAKEVAAPAARPDRKEAAVSPDSSVTRAATVNFGTLTIETTPAGAEIYINGSPAGSSPINGKRIPAGSASVRLSLSG